MATQEQVLAELGATVRLEQLAKERLAILKVFPHLAGTGYTRRKVSKAARAAMSEGMRKFWARRKAGAKKKKS